MQLEGLQQFRDKIKQFEDEVARNIEAGVEFEVRAMQQETADLVPVDEGVGRAALLDPSALRKVKSPDGPGVRFIFGLDVPALSRRAFYLYWVEFGTKGYSKGDRRFAGKTKQGRSKMKKLKRAVPPRPAQPFWRPAEQNMWLRLEARLNMQRLVSTAKRLASLADGS